VYSKNQPRTFDARKKIMDNILWDLRTLDINRWNWVRTCHIADLVKWVIQIVGALIVTHEYSCTNLDDQLFHVNPNIVQIPLLKVKFVRVFMQVKKSHTRSFPLVWRTPLVRKACFGFLNMGLLLISNGTPMNGFGEG
jgi:hypothetical protein